MAERSDASLCAWCGAPLTEGEVFQFELELAGWREGGLFAPENPDFERARDEPLPRCTACRSSINENYDGIRAERGRPDFWMRVLKSCALLGLVSLTAMVLAAFILRLL